MWAQLWSSRHPGQLLELPEQDHPVHTLDLDVRQRAEEIAGGGVRRAPTGRGNKRQPGLFDNLPIGRGIEDLEGSVAVAAELSVAELFWKDPPFVDKRQMLMFDVAVVEPGPAVAVVQQKQVQVVVRQEPVTPVSREPITDDDIPF